MVTVTRRIVGRGRPAISEEKKDQIVEAFNAGQNCKEITGIYGISKTTFYKIIKERSEVQYNG